MKTITVPAEYKQHYRYNAPAAARSSGGSVRVTGQRTVAKPSSALLRLGQTYAEGRAGHKEHRRWQTRQQSRRTRQPATVLVGHKVMALSTWYRRSEHCSETQEQRANTLTTRSRPSQRPTVRPSSCELHTAPLFALFLLLNCALLYTPAAPNTAVPSVPFQSRVTAPFQTKRPIPLFSASPSYSVISLSHSVSKPFNSPPTI